MRASGTLPLRAALLVGALLGSLAPALSSCRRELPPLPMSGDKIRLEVKGKELLVEIASSRLARENGLMFRESIPESSGMLFVYSQPQKLSFWMRNTTIPLSIAFLDDTGKILEIADMHPKDEARTVSMYMVRYALEVNQGWFRRNGIGVGDSFSDFAGKVAPYRG